MSLYIQFIDLPEEVVFGEICRWGRIEVGNFVESFAIPVEIWSMEKYKAQWYKSLKAIIDGADKACLITAIRNPDISDFISMFALYRSGESVFVQNQIMLCSKYNLEIKNEELGKLIGERETHSEDGCKISEWETSIYAIILPEME